MHSNRGCPICGKELEVDNLELLNDRVHCVHYCSICFKEWKVVFAMQTATLIESNYKPLYKGDK